MKLKYTALIFLLCSTLSAKNMLPLTCGESVLEPFFGPYFGMHYQEWKTETLKGDFKVRWGKKWYYLTSSGQGASGRMVREYKHPVDCRNFDKLVFGFRPHDAAEGTTVTLEAFTDIGVRKSSALVKKSKEFTELALDIGGAKNIEKIILTFTAPSAAKGYWNGQLRFVILRNSKQFAMFRQYYDDFAKFDWEGLLKPESYRPEFKCTYNLFFQEGTFPEYRKFYKSLPDAVLKGWAESSAKFAGPENFIDADLVESAFRRQYVIDKYKKFNISWPGGHLYQRGSVLALGAMVYKDPKFMRLAARYALSLATISNWNDYGVFDQTPGSWYLTAFSAGAICRDLSFILDLAGEMLSKDGRRYIIQAMARKGLALSQYSMWSRPAFKSNQYSIFACAQIPSLLLLEKEFADSNPRIRAYTDLAISDLDHSCNELFNSDGGFFDCSTAYLGVSINDVAQCYNMYANARDKKLSEVVAGNLKRTENLAAVLDSTEKRSGAQIINIGQSYGNYLSPSVSGFLAACSPDSAWTNIFARTPGSMLARSISRLDYRTWQYQQMLKNAPGQLHIKPLVEIPSCGLVSSLREHAGEKVKFVFMGYNRNNKRNEDIGDFVLQFAGDSFAMSTPYSWGKYSRCDWHNLLVPTGGKKAAAYKYRHRATVIPKAAGNEKSFEASMDLSEVWDKSSFSKISRAVNSPSPDTFIITDEYSAGDGVTGVDFLWHTYLPAKLEGKTIVITGNYGGRCEISVPENCSARIEQFTRTRKICKGLSLPVDQQFSKIIIHKDGREGRLSISIRLIKSDN